MEGKEGEERGKEGKEGRERTEGLALEMGDKHGYREVQPRIADTLPCLSSALLI